MTRDEDQCFRINRILLLTIGLWPYQQSSFTTCQYIFNCTILTTFFIFQLTTFLTLNYTLEFFMKVSSSISFFIIPIIKYNLFRVNIKGMKDLLMQLQHVHNELKDKNEIAIIKKYNCTAKCYTIVLTTIGVCIIPLNIIYQFWINMTNVDLPMNVSQSIYFLVTMEYFIDQEKYFYLVILHFTAAFCIGLAVMTAIGTMFIACAQYTCGMFRIASYRLKHAINNTIRQNITLENKILMIKGIICAVDIHRQAIKLNKHLLSLEEIIFFCLVICCVTCLSLNLFQIASFENDTRNLLMSFVYTSICITYMFLSNYIAQSITDHSNHVITTAYNVQWYKTPLHIQRMILFLLQRGSQEFILNIGGLFCGSIENFAMLVKASVSYFTVICSTRS